MLLTPDMTDVKSDISVKKMHVRTDKGIKRHFLSFSVVSVISVISVSRVNRWPGVNFGLDFMALNSARKS